MLLNSYTFLLIFLPVVVVLYWVMPRGYARLLFLVAASLVFYGLWDWRFIPLLLATTLVDWVAGRSLAASEAEGASRRRKLILAAAVAVNLAFLGYFKYRGFFVDQLDGILRLLGAGEPLPPVEMLLPIGISFYTFAGISYTVDMYRGSTGRRRAWSTTWPGSRSSPTSSPAPSSATGMWAPSSSARSSASAGRSSAPASSSSSWGSPRRCWWPT